MLGDVWEGEIIDGRFRLLRVIGEGGMGIVWAAHHERIDRDVAIKFLHADMLVSPDVRQRFMAEARAAGRFRHPNIVDVIDTGETTDGTPFIVFELLDGESLEEKLITAGRLGRRASTLIAIELCRALEAAHGAGVVHRDLKPGNVFLHRTATGITVVKVLDFGISKRITEELSLTKAGTVMGTPQYMSAEQARGETGIDARSDLWSVGAILFEMLVGRTPFEGANHGDTIYKIVNEEPSFDAAGREIPMGLVAIVEKCLAKDRALRFQSAHELRLALERVEATLLDTGTNLLNIGRVSRPAFTSSEDLLPPLRATPSRPSAAVSTDRPVATSAPPPISVPARTRRSRATPPILAGSAAVLLLAVALRSRTRATETAAVAPAVAPISNASPGEPRAPVDVLPLPAPVAVAPDVPSFAEAASAATPAPAPLPRRPKAMDDVRANGRVPSRPPASASVAAPSAAPPAPKTKVDNAGF